MMKRFRFTGLVLMLALASLALRATADVRVVNMSVSPRVLMSLYDQSKQGGTLTWPSEQVLMILLNSDAPASSFSFRLEIRNGSNLVAGAQPFQVEPLVKGSNSFSAGQIKANNLTVDFNAAYIPGTVGQGGSVMPMGDYKMVLIPLSPNGPPYTMNLALFAPSSSLNTPPVPIYPKEVEVNSTLPTFSWTPVQKAKNYELLVSPDQNPGVNTYWDSGRITGNQVLYSPAARALVNGQKYFWQVQAFDDFGKPVGGVDGRSQPTWFIVNSAIQVSNAVSPVEVDAALRTALGDRVDFTAFNLYMPITVETTSPDLAGLLRQLRDGSAKVLEIQTE
jgi:hypothetical protein